MMEAIMPKTQTPTPKLSDTQLVMLGAAAQRDDHSLLPWPESLTTKGVALDKIIESLRKRNLIEQRRIVDGAPAWRRDEENHPYGLFITTAGLLALGVEEADEERSSEAAAAAPRKRKTVIARPPDHKYTRPASGISKRAPAPGQTKQDFVIRMLRRRCGATIDDIVAETGWQPHSVRGFFSGLVRKKLALPLTSEVGKDGVRRYRIASGSSSRG
jgi:hypothetical protein